MKNLSCPLTIPRINNHRIETIGQIVSFDLPKANVWSVESERASLPECASLARKYLQGARDATTSWNVETRSRGLSTRDGDTTPCPLLTVRISTLSYHMR